MRYKKFTSRTVYQLADEQFEQLIESASIRTKGRPATKKAKQLHRQRAIECLAVERGFFFPDDYEFHGSKNFKLLCPEHGEIETGAHRFVKSDGNGCRFCGYEKVKTEQRRKYRSEFMAVVEKATGVTVKDPDFAFINGKTAIEMVCKTHGDFLLTPDGAKRAAKDGKNGCQKCGKLNGAKRSPVIRKLCREAELAFLEAVESADGIMLADGARYIGARKSVKLVCNRHGIFKSTPDNFKRGKRCMACYREDRQGQALFERAIKKTKEIIENIPGIRLSEDYLSEDKLRLTLVCDEHGEFNILRTNLNHSIKKGMNGCPKCGHVFRNEGNKREAKKYFETCVSECPNTTLAPSYDYINAHAKVDVICKWHGLYQVAPNHFKQDSTTGCKKCKHESINWKILFRKKYLWGRERDLYFNTFFHEGKTFYKVGITSPGKERFKQSMLDKAGVQLVKENRITTTNYLALMTEYYVKTRFRHHALDMMDVLNRNGNFMNGGTECFSVDLLESKPLDELIGEAKAIEHELIQEAQIARK